jgi:superfamily II DNA or RNA helicase
MAGNNDQSDPFLWDEDRVVLELCTPNRSWKAPQAKRLPDPAALKARIYDCGVDGESLLTYGDEFDFDKLWAYLGVKKLPHQLSLKEAIAQFRRRSLRYREWKTQQLADSQLCGEEIDGMTIESESHQPAGPEHASHATPVLEPMAIDGNTDIEPPAHSGPNALSPAPSASADRRLAAPPEVSETSGIDQQPVEEPPSKKRRIAPTAISAKPTGNSALTAIPTEGDALLRGTVDTLLQAGSSSGFLGSGILLHRKLTDSKNIDQTYGKKDGFAGVRAQVPPGRRIQASAAMKRFLRTGRVDRADVSEPTQDSDVDSEWDNDSVDSATWREYEQEEKDRAAMEARNAAAEDRFLSKDEVTEAVRNVVHELESQWVAEKKPKYDLKAWRTWQDARLNPDRLSFISSAKRQLDHCDDQIALYSKQIIKQPWTSGDDVQRKSMSWLEGHVFEKKRQTWLIDVIESPRPPPKPTALPRLTPKPVKPAVLDDDSEVLTSDSDDMDEFIEYDDNVPFVPDDMEIDSEPPSGPATAAPVSRDGDDSATRGDEVDAGLSPERASPGEQPDNALPPAQPTPKKIKSEKFLLPATPRCPGTSAQAPIEIGLSPSPFKKLDTVQVPSLYDLESLEKIGEIGVGHWESVKDGIRLVVAVLCEWPRGKIAKLHAAIKGRDHKDLWGEYLEPAIEDPDSATADSTSLVLCRLFDVFVSGSAKRVHLQHLRPLTCMRMEREGGKFADFCEHLRRIIPLFLGVVPPAPTRIVIKTPPEESPSTQQTLEICDPVDDPSVSEGSSSDDMLEPSTKKRRRPKRRDKVAADIRVNALKLNEELERRRRQLREKMAEQGPVSGKLSRLIVNETKESDDQALIYINDHIGAKIKDHQIDGVRFMWNQVVVDSKIRQGCLLAHTMGLGKTMQVITLLVVIAESSASPDESVRSQIPENLRESKTLILCPPSLVDNWHDEIKMWAPDEVLGPVRRSDGATPAKRMGPIQAWASSGGVLILGYTMFANLVLGDEEVAKLLLETPNLVVGDEAHYMKNPESQRHQAAAGFKTMNRIAMTGSPLTNNVMDYYAMINWVAPHYLADIAEFRQRFANPIKEGLYADSDTYQKRKARKMLHVLKATVDPKVHRRDIEVLVGELPRKKEFIITLPLTKVQLRLYQTYIEWVSGPGRELMTGQAKAWSLVANLGLVLAHPFIFKTVAETQKAKPLGSKAQSSKLAKAANAEDDEDRVEMPQDVLIRLLATVAVREIEDYALSNKILVLLRILDECRKVGDKVLLFSQSISTLDYIENIFKRQRVVYQRLDGHTPMSTRQDSVKRFNTDSESQVYLVSTKAGVGLNIYGANRVVIFDFKYTPTDEQQAIGRAYRLGQSKPVYVYWLTIGGTFEDTIHNNAVFKTQLASRVVDKKNPDPWSTRFSEYFVMPRPVDQEDLTGAFGQDKVLDVLLKDERVGKLMRKITSTETFEREEAYELTPEDRQEAENDIEMERLRLHNPVEYRRREQERALQARSMPGMGMPPVQPLAFYQPRPADGEFPSPGKRVVRIKVPEHLRDKRKPAPPVPDVASGAVSFQHTVLPSQPDNDHTQQQVLTFTSDSALLSPPNQPMQHATNFTTPAPTQPSPPVQGNPVAVPPTSAPNLGDVSNASPQAAVPRPIAATGTHFKIATPSPARLGSPKNASPAADRPLDTNDLPTLIAVHRTLCDEGRHVRYHPTDLVSRVEAALDRSKVERLPRLDKIQNLKKCARDPRFAEAMLSGYMEPEQLVSLTRMGMEEISTSLSGMAEGEFKQRVWTTKADLNVCTPPAPRTPKTVSQQSN